MRIAGEPEGGSAAGGRFGIASNIAVLVSLGLILLAAVGALLLVEGISGQLADIARAQEVRNVARELTKSLSDAESSRRGYLLTNDDDYLARYRASAGDIEAKLLKLSDLTAGDERQASQVRAVASEIMDRANAMGRSVEALLAQGSQDMRQPIETASGTLLMERFIAEEDQKLVVRNAEVAAARQWLLGALIIALAAAILLGYSLFRRSQRTVSELTRSTSLLHSENEVLEAHIRDRTQALEEARLHADQERHRVEALLQDANHRIGNSLATVSSLLGLQLIRTKSAEVRDALEAARGRVHAIASAHRRLRLGSDLETASADEFLGAVLEDIITTATDAKAITMTGDFEPIVVPARDATTIGILVGELVTNALKHAFPDGRPGTIQVSLKRNEAGVPVLSVVDDGVGLPSGTHPGDGGLGSVIVQQLAGQFGGSPDYEDPPEGGLAVRVRMPGLAGQTSDVTDQSPGD